MAEERPQLRARQRAHPDKHARSGMEHQREAGQHNKCRRAEGGACRTQRARVLRAHSFLRERGGDRTALPAQHRSRVRSMVDKQHEPLRSTQRLSDSRHQRDSHKMELQGDKPPDRLPDAALQARRVPHAEQICRCQHMGLGPSLPRGMVSGRQVHGAHGTDQRRR